MLALRQYSCRTPAPRVSGHLETEMNLMDEMFQDCMTNPGCREIIEQYFQTYRHAETKEDEYMAMCQACANIWSVAWIRAKQIYSQPVFAESACDLPGRIKWPSA